MGGCNASLRGPRAELRPDPNIQFDGNAKPVTPEEQHAYANIMKSLQDKGEKDGVLAFADSSFDANGDGKSEFLLCAGKKREKFGCMVARIKPDGKVEKTISWSSVKTPFNLRGLDIVDTRRGDIDGDGDNDIAFQVSSGAIYVYHNLRVVGRSL